MSDMDGGFVVPDWAADTLKDTLTRGGLLQGNVTVRLPKPPDGKKWVLKEGERRFDGPLLEAVAE